MSKSNGRSMKKFTGELGNHNKESISIQIGNDSGKVILYFGRPVAWIAMRPDQALDIANGLREKAKELQF